jgi:hypothetical protein
MTILLFLLPRTTPVVVTLLIVMFALSVHFVWNCWWIENKRWRQLFALLILAGILVGIGFAITPRVELEVSIAGAEFLSVAKSDESEIRLTVEAENNGNASGFPDKVSLQVMLPSGVLQGRQMLGEPRPLGGAELLSFMEQEFVPHKRIIGIVTFIFPIELKKLQEKACKSLRDSDGGLMITVADWGGKQWSVRKSFIDEVKEMPCTVTATSLEKKVVQPARRTGEKKPAPSSPPNEAPRANNPTQIITTGSYSPVTTGPDSPIIQIGKQMPPPRVIMQSKADAAIALLKPTPGEVRFTVIGGSNEINSFSNQIINMFAEGGWRIVGTDMIGQFTGTTSYGSGINTTHGEGLNCYSPSPDSAKAKAALGALTAAGFPCQATAFPTIKFRPDGQGGTSPDMQISIGTRILPEQ